VKVKGCLVAAGLAEEVTLVTVGALLTVTEKLHALVLPESSVAVEVTVVVPTGKTDPEGGLLTTVTP